MKTLLITLLTIFAITSFGQNMQQYLSETQQMVSEKKYDEALDRYIWFQDHALENDQSMTGVRLSFALSYWKSLADIYPPAMTALKKMRDDKTKEILDSNASSKFFADVAALNRTLEREDKTIELFESITKQHPEKAKLCWHYVKDALFKAKRYDILKNYIGNPMNEFTLIKSRYESTMADQKGENFNTPEFIAIKPQLKIFNDNHFVENSIELIEFSIAVNDVQSAKKIRKKAMGIVKDNRLRDIKIN